MAGRGKDRSDIEFLNVFDESDDCFLTASEVRDSLSYKTNKNVNRRLRELAEDGLVDSKRVGNGLAWWLTEEGRDYLEEQSEA